MGFWGDIGHRVRGMLRFDKEQIVLNLSKGGTNSGYPQTGFDLLQAYGQDILSDYLKLEHDLMARFVDYEEMDDYPELACLHGDSLVFTLEYGWEAICSLAVRGGSFHVLAYDRETRSLVPAMARNARATGAAGHFKQMVRVVMDNGQAIVCTADHMFFTKEENWIQASGLRAGQRLMPGVLRSRSLNGDSDGSYWEVHQPNSDSAIRTSDGKRWTWVHRLVGEMMLGAERGDIVHHKDENSLNNAPGNLSVETYSSHAGVHIARINNSSYLPEWNDERRRAKSLAMLGNSHRIGKRDNAETRAKKSAARAGRPLTEEHRRRIGDAHRVSFTRDQVESAYRSGGSIAEAARILGVSWSTARRNLDRYDLIVDDGNHRVVRVEFLDDRTEVFDLEVPGYHNFVCNGVVVHNSAIDIYADDATQTESLQNKVVWIDSPDKTVQMILEDLLWKRLRIDEEVWEITRTLVKYGNDYEELLVTGDGLVGLNFLPPPTMRRIEGRRGELYGFVQDYKGRFGYSPEEFKQLLTQRQAGGNDPRNKYAALEDWEISHFRLRSKHRRSIYGYCLTAESRVWTQRGLVEIADIGVGDKVLTRHAGMIRTTNVVDTVCSGIKPVYKLKTKHRELRLTGEHPVLVDRGGKNNAWVPVADVKAGEKIIIATAMPELSGPPALGIRLLEFGEDPVVQITERGAQALRERARMGRCAPKLEGIRPAAQRVGITRGHLEELLAGKSGVKLSQLRGLFAEVELPLFEGGFALDKDARLTLPDFVDASFARLFGFLLGDGWITDGQVYFALGTDEDQNRFYERIFSDMGLPVARTKDASGVERQSYVSSQALVKIISDLGWISGAHHKRVPAWVFSGPIDLRKAFLRGFMDADGWKTRDSKYEHTELCNRELLRDLKNLIDGVGWTSGNIRRRGPRDTEINGKEVHSGEQFILTFHETKLGDGDFYSEEIISLEPDGEEPVYDIEVSDSGHNFIADGIVVHNSVLEPARWIWKRLMLLEDAAMVYRLQRAPQRYAFYIDVGDMPPKEAMGFLHKMRQQYKKTKFYNPQTGKLDLKYNPLSQDEDFFVPVRKGVQATKIDVVGSPSWQHMEDIEYFKLKLYAAIKVPKVYLGSEAPRAKGVLSQEDVRFARTVLRIQREVRNGIKKMCRVHLAALGINPSQVDFEVYMTTPSSIFELAQLEVRNAKADFAGRMSQFVSLHWILQKVFGLSEEEIEYIIKERHQEQLSDAEIQAKSMGLTMDVQNTAALKQQAGAAAVQQQQMATAEPNTQAAEDLRKHFRRVGSMSHTWPQMRHNLGYRPISEQELFHGNREHEKLVGDNLEKILESNTSLSRRLAELGQLVNELKMSMPGR